MEKVLKRNVVWTHDQEQALIDAVEEFGYGKWKQILESEKYGARIGSDHTNVDCSNRYRRFTAPNSTEAGRLRKRGYSTMSASSSSSSSTAPLQTDDTAMAAPPAKKPALTAERPYNASSSSSAAAPSFPPSSVSSSSSFPPPEESNAVSFANPPEPNAEHYAWCRALNPGNRECDMLHLNLHIYQISTNLDVHLKPPDTSNLPQDDMLVTREANGKTFVENIIRSKKNRVVSSEKFDVDAVVGACAAGLNDGYNMSEEEERAILDQSNFTEYDVNAYMDIRHRFADFTPPQQNTVLYTYKQFRLFLATYLCMNPSDSFRLCLKLSQQVDGTARYSLVAPLIQARLLLLSHALEREKKMEQQQQQQEA